MAWWIAHDLTLVNPDPNLDRNHNKDTQFEFNNYYLAPAITCPTPTSKNDQSAPIYPPVYDTYE